mgnify:FL=1
MMTAKQSIFMRRWSNIRKNKEHMEELILKLMENPATEPEHLAQAHDMYSDVCKRMSEISHHVSNIIRTGSTTAVEIYEFTCCCGHTSKQIKGETFRCPNCGMN